MATTWLFLAFSLALIGDIVADESLEWWQTTVFYQIYPRSFKDSDGDGVGDLNGIAEKLDHLKDAGVGAVWLSPIYKSPMYDFGYDISDFKDVDSTFGTIDDFSNLQSRAKELDIKLILDFVPNHSSNESVWFQKSLLKIDPYTDYYVWKDPKFDANGNRIPPSNWLSIFGGSMWEWSDERQQYYLHQFGSYQPDFNFRNPDLVQEMKDVLNFWLDKGVDGFRIDAVPHLFEDEGLNDEPLSGNPTAISGESNSLTHIYTQNLPETYDMIQQWRKLLDDRKAVDGTSRVLMLETYATLELVMEYYGTEERPGGNFPFNFLLVNDLNNASSAYDFNATVHKWMDNMPAGRWPNWVLGNHDNRRVASRYGPELVDGLNMLALLLPGSAITYNGEEIGMVDLFISYEDTVDPFGKNAGPDRYQIYTRDPPRTPFQWDNSTSSGFSTNVKTWLPVNPNYLTLNLEKEKAAEKSHYKVYQSLVKLRKLPVIQKGELKTYPASEKVFAFSREMNSSDPIVVVINLGNATENVKLDVFNEVPDIWSVLVASIDSKRTAGSPVEIGKLVLDPKEALVLTAKIEHTPLKKHQDKRQIFRPSN